MIVGSHGESSAATGQRNRAGDKLRARALAALAKWHAFSETYWEGDTGRRGEGFFATGYSGWGVQTNQKYLSAMAVLASHAGSFGLAASTGVIREKALAALKFSVESHISGRGKCSDGRQWGHHWLAALGIERMMHGVELLRPWFDEDFDDSFNRMLASEADWIHQHYHRDGVEGITGALWSEQGGNGPESNIWAGALLWRAASLLPDHPSVRAWKETAHDFLINGVSIPADANDQRICAGESLASRFRGANFFPHFALDHHQYLNVGYMGICVSNAAILHFDSKVAGMAPPASLYHHQKDLWQVLRRMVFSDGRLARIGGDSRVRYAYCQDYLIPALLFAADQFGDAAAPDLISRALDWMEEEQEFNADGSFFGRRLESLRESNPYYFLRLESDRACVLGMLAAYGELVQCPEPVEETEVSLAGSWIEPEHGAMLDRCPTRFASFSWNAFSKAQGLCLPPEEGHLAEWLHNLSGWVHFAPQRRDEQAHIRRVLGHSSVSFEGGFLTIGALAEGGNSKWAEGWSAADGAIHWMAMVALPDGHTMIGLQLCQTADWKTYVIEAKALHLNIPNDLFNGFKRTFHSRHGQSVLEAPASREEIVDFDSEWINVDGKIGVNIAYGAPSLVACRNPLRMGEKYRGLYVEEICLPIERRCRAVAPETVLFDAGWVVQASVSPEQTAKTSAGITVDTSPPWVRRMTVPAMDGAVYEVTARFAEANFSKSFVRSPAEISVRRNDGWEVSTGSAKPE